MSLYSLLADAFCYPHPELLPRLKAGLLKAGAGPGWCGLAAFVEKIDLLSLSDWEELCTRTLDLSPAAAPYVGFQVWGESYQRGEFMSKLNRSMFNLGVDTEGELPDHLIPVLRYLALTDQPIPDLVENLEPAVARMFVILNDKDKDNPYLNLFEAVLDVYKKV